MRDIRALAEVETRLRADKARLNLVPLIAKTMRDDAVAIAPYLDPSRAHTPLGYPLWVMRTNRPIIESEEHSIAMDTTCTTYHRTDSGLVINGIGSVLKFVAKAQSTDREPWFDGVGIRSAEAVNDYELATPSELPESISADVVPEIIQRWRTDLMKLTVQ